MATTCTAELIFGTADQNDSGIQFNHRLTVYEGMKAMLVLERKPSLTDGGALIDRWLCYTDKFIEDAMVMIAAYGAGNKEILEIVNELKQGQAEEDIFRLYDVEASTMDRLYELSRKAFQLKISRTKNSVSAERKKITACIFKGSSLWNNLQKFRDYDIDIEICRSVFQSEYSAWNGRINEWGEL